MNVHARPIKISQQLKFFGRVRKAEMGKMIELEERTHTVGTITRSRPRLS
jgi:hypothetical protein